jgi:cell division protein FtsA
MSRNEKIFAAVDIGSTKVVALVGQKTDGGKIQVMGMGHSPSQGIKRGVVLNVEEAFLAINDALTQAGNECRQKIESVFVNISGQQLNTLTSIQKGKIGKDRTVSEADVKLMTDQARQIPLPEGMAIYHVNSEFFSVGNESGILNPVGVVGDQIEGIFKLHIAPEYYSQNIQTCFKKGSISLQKAVLDPIASSGVILTEDEKEAGVALVDIGGGTTKISIFRDGVLCFTSMVPFGGNVLTHDIREGCAITIKQAESLKVKFGQAMSDFASDTKVVTIPIQGWEPRQVAVKSLAKIIQARIEEIVDGFAFQIRKSGYADKLDAGIVITGGTSLLPNLNQLIKFRTGYDVRLGQPNLFDFIFNKELEDPRFATVIGLLKLAAEHEGFVKIKKVKRPKVKSDEPGIIEKVQKRFVQGEKKFVQGVLTFFDEKTNDAEM